MMEDREIEIMALSGSDERWENWMQYVQSRMLPRFTEHGYDVIDTPKHIQAKLKAMIDRAVKDFDNLPIEAGEGSIYGPFKPKFVELGALRLEVLEELKELHEMWAGGIELIPTSAYGVRLYRNGSSMVMHNDKTTTHVISSIVHIAHEYDNDDEPWPIEIDDHDGVLRAVDLKEGQMMFYESAKCLHGRRSQLKGKYYGSLFVHYQPADKSLWDYKNIDVTYNVPPHWSDGTKERYGSRWAGQAITVDSRVVQGAPPRVDGNDHPAFTDDYVEEDEL